MDCASNYTALIQLAVTFSFVFVVLRQESVNLADEVISAIFKKMRKKAREEGDSLISFIPYQSLDLCAQNRRSAIEKDFNTVRSMFDLFYNLVHWKPKYMSSWCLFCGLYSLVLLFLYAELAKSTGFQVFFQSFVILSTFFNLYYIILEFIMYSKEDRNGCEQPFGSHLSVFILIVCLSFFCFFYFKEPGHFINDRFLFYWSVALSFFPFILVGLLAGLFFLIGKVYEYRLCDKIEDLYIDYHNAVKEAKSTQTFGFGKPDGSDGLGFGKTD